MLAHSDSTLPPGLTLAPLFPAPPTSSLQVCVSSFFLSLQNAMLSVGFSWVCTNTYAQSDNLSVVGFLYTHTHTHTHTSPSKLLLLSCLSAGVPFSPIRAQLWVPENPRNLERAQAVSSLVFLLTALLAGSPSPAAGLGRSPPGSDIPGSRGMAMWVGAGRAGKGFVCLGFFSVNIFVHLP